MAVVPSDEIGRDVAKAMEAAFLESGNLEINYSRIVQVDLTGARSADRSEIPAL